MVWQDEWEHTLRYSTGGRGVCITPSGVKWPAMCHQRFAPPEGILGYERLHPSQVLPAASDANHRLGALKHLTHHRRIGHTTLAQPLHQGIGVIGRHRDE
jgi:hypothetical protein